MAAHSNPPLITIEQPRYRMGKLAMQMVRQLIQGQQTLSSGYTLMESPLVVRESTGPYRVISPGKIKIAANSSSRNLYKKMKSQLKTGSSF